MPKNRDIFYLNHAAVFYCFYLYMNTSDSFISPRHFPSLTIVNCSINSSVTSNTCLFALLRKSSVSAKKSRRRFPSTESVFKTSVTSINNFFELISCFQPCFSAIFISSSDIWMSVIALLEIMT